MLLTTGKSIRRMTLAGTVIFGLLAGVTFAEEPVADPDPARFEEFIQNFVAHDTKNSFPENAILFVGSSSVRFWATAEAFPDKQIINRGFGGSHMSDLIHYYETVVKPYKPSKVFIYEGDNDIGSGKSAERVVADFETFFKRAQADLPDTQFLVLAIKPSKLRWEKWAAMEQANEMIREYTNRDADLVYVDVASPLLGDDGKPKDVFVEDGLHLNKAGYELWRDTVAPYLE